MGADTGLRRFLACMAALAVLKLTEVWLVTPLLGGDPATCTRPARTEGLKEPRVSHPRCDACRAAALLLDSVLREADSLLEPGGGELDRAEVEAIVASVCHPSSFQTAELVSWEGNPRLAIPHLETWAMRGTPHLEGLGMNWAGRMADHCHHLQGHPRMDAAELYDLWLRSSVWHWRYIMYMLFLYAFSAGPVTGTRRSGWRFFAR
jgi:hypothetical protein